MQPDNGRGMRKSHSVTFSVDELASSDGGQPSSSKPTKLRYSQLFKSIAGSVGGSEVSPTPIPQFSFDSSAQPAKPAMKHATGSGSSNSHVRSTDMYPSVLDSPTHPAPPQGYNSQEQHYALHAGPQTHGGLALSSALGAQTIPPSCPPALPPVVASPGSYLLPHQLLTTTGNVLAGQEPDAPRVPREGSPSAASADVTVQLSTMGSENVAAGIKAYHSDVSARDQNSTADEAQGWQQQQQPAPELNPHDAVVNWQTHPGTTAGGGGHGSSGGAGGGGAGGGPCDDDNASSGLIIPPGCQAPLPTFSSQLTPRAVVVGLMVGMAFVLLTMRLALVTGMAFNLQVAIAGCCWAVLRLYTLLLGRDMACIPPITAQEVAVAASAALAVASSSAAGGFGTLLLALQQPLAQRVGEAVPGNLPSLVWTFEYWKLVCWLLMVGLGGALLMLPFRRILFSRPSMTFATGAAAGQLINTLHTPAMSYHGHKQALNYTWNFDFELSFVGLGLIAPVSVAWSMIVGGIISWGLLWPVFSGKQGSWFPAGLAEWDTRGVYGYYLAGALGLLLADAAYHMVRGVVTTVVSYLPEHEASTCCSSERATAAQDGLEEQYDPSAYELAKRKKKKSKHAWKREALRIIETDTLSDASALQFSLAAMERALRQHIFMAEGGLASWLGILGFVVCMAAAVGGLPTLFSPNNGFVAGGGDRGNASGELVVYYVLVAAVMAAFAALANARGAGVTDVNMADVYAKLGIMVFAGWAGQGVGSVGTGLACSGLLLGSSTAALNALYAWRTGFMTMASPVAVFISHIVGLVAGAAFAPLAWLLYAHVAGGAGSSTAGGLLSAADGFFASPLASVFRSTAAIATGGVSTLPTHCLWVGLGAVVVAIGLNILRDTLPVQARGLIPIPAAIGVVCLSGASIAVDLAVGAVARIFWRWRYPRSAEAYSLSVGTALIAGPGLFAVAKGILAAFAVQPPICMSFSLAPAV
eukprot:gene7935-8131_t